MALSKNSPKDLVKRSNELTASIQLWAVSRRETVQALRSLADELMQHDRNVHIAKLSGSSFSIAGFVLVATGFGLAPVSFGTSLILSAVGGAMCASGGATAAGSSIARSKIFKSKLATAQSIIDADREAQTPVEKLLNELYREVSKVSFGSLKDQISYKVSVLSLIKNLVDVGKCAKAGAKAGAIAAGEGVEAVLRTIGTVGNVVRIGVFAISAAFLPFDIYTMVTSAKEVDSHRRGREDRGPDAVRKLRQLANDLEREMDEMLQAVRVFEKLSL